VKCRERLTKALSTQNRYPPELVWKTWQTTALVLRSQLRMIFPSCMSLTWLHAGIAILTDLVYSCTPRTRLVSHCNCHPRNERQFSISNKNRTLGSIPWINVHYPPTAERNTNSTTTMVYSPDVKAWTTTPSLITHSRLTQYTTVRTEKIPVDFRRHVTMNGTSMHVARLLSYQRADQEHSVALDFE
jgi:hypothetical protein